MRGSSFQMLSVSSLVLALGVSVALSGVAPGTAHAAEFQDGSQAVEISDQGTTVPASRPARARSFAPRVGRSAASKYMAPKRPDEAQAEPASNNHERHVASAGPSDHYLAVHVGAFVNDNAYKWGTPDNQQNVGSYNLGLTYRMGEWINSMDLLFRFDVSRINLAEGGVTKFSFLPVVTFPDATSRFPLYFGAGAGLGVFGTQIAGESAISLDYQMLAGARFFNIWGTTGLFVEGGIKNHILLLSDGQYNGTFIATGLVFTF